MDEPESLGEKPRESDLGPGTVEAIRIIERGKTLRAVTICVCITVGVGMIVWGLIQIADQPPWLTLSLAILAALAGPSGILYVVIRSWRKYIEESHRRTVQLEQQLFRNRSSSSLKDSETGRSD
jgi:hypothetical protein